MTQKRMNDRAGWPILAESTDGSACSFEIDARGDSAARPEGPRGARRSLTVPGASATVRARMDAFFYRSPA